MTTFTGPVHVRASADGPTGQNVYQAAVPLGTISLVSAGGTSTIVTAGAAGQVFAVIATAGMEVRARGMVKILVEGTVALVPFYYSAS